MASIAQSVCYRKHGSQDASCEDMRSGRYMLIFGAMEILFSQLQDMHRVWWLSIVATLMSFSYSFILLTLSATKASEHGHSHGTAFGVAVGPHDVLGDVSPYQKTLGVLQAIGNMSYSFLFTSVLIEIQDTLKCSPPENKTMKKAISVGVLYTTIFYMALGGIGYAAYGSKTPGNLLQALGSYHHVFWLVDLANLFIIIQIMGAYQVNAQPIFGFVEDHAVKYFRRRRIINEEQPSHVVLFQTKFTVDHLTIFRIVWRTAFVILTTFISMALPFFNAILGLLGAMAYWPLTIYFPVNMHMRQSKVRPWSAKWIGLQLFVGVFLLVSCSGIAGSIQGILQAVKGHQAFRI
ncbi:hypothetical protein O6H91_03G127200 [Diphasiastrum complanatum]|nr:hypothetical protein O6H91_03G127200 [Diphasiastrum complanatum]